MLSLLTHIYPLTVPVLSYTISTPWGTLHHYHYRRWLNNHDANLVHFPDTHFATGRTGIRESLLTNMLNPNDEISLCGQTA